LLYSTNTTRALGLELGVMAYIDEWYYILFGGHIWASVLGSTAYIEVKHVSLLLGFM